MKTRRDANGDPRTPANLAAFDKILALSNVILDARRRGQRDVESAAVLHDALLEHYPEYVHKIAAARRNRSSAIIAFNPDLALINVAEEIDWWTSRGGPYRGPRAVFFQGSPEEFAWEAGAPAYVYADRTWEGLVQRSDTWRRHGIVVYVDPHVGDRPRRRRP